MEFNKLSRVCASIVASVVLSVNSLYGQAQVQTVLQPTVVVPPNSNPQGSDTGEIRLMEAKSLGTDYVSLRGAVSVPEKFRLRMPGTFGTLDDCIHRGAQVVDADTVKSFPLYFGPCGGGGSSWISATDDAAHSHVSSVYSNTPGDAVGWIVNRARGTGGAPLDTAVGDSIFNASYTARVTGTFHSMISMSSTRQTGGINAVADWKIFTHDSSGTPYTKLRIYDHIYFGGDVLPDVPATRNIGASGNEFLTARITSLFSNTVSPPSGIFNVAGNMTITGGHFGSSGTRVPKIWVTDFDCNGTGCPGGASVWSRNSGAGLLFASTVTDDVQVRQLYLEDYTGGSPGLRFRIRASVSGASPSSKYMEFQDQAGQTMFELRREKFGIIDSRAVFYQNIFPDIHQGRTMGDINVRWGQFWGSGGNFAGDVTPDQNYLFTHRNLGGPTLKWEKVYANEIVADIIPGYWSLFVNPGPVNVLTPNLVNVRLGLGTSSPSEMLEVAGNVKVRDFLYMTGSGGSSNLYCVTDGGCRVGDSSGTAGRFLHMAIVGQFNAYDPGGSQVRASLSAGGLFLRSTGGAVVAQIALPSGNIFTTNGVSANNGYTAGGLAGLTRNIVVTGIGGGLCTLSVQGGIIWFTSCP